MRIDLDDLGFDRGAYILVARALAPLAAGDAVEVTGRDTNLALHVTTWCRARGHVVERIGAGKLRIRRRQKVRTMRP